MISERQTISNFFKSIPVWVSIVTFISFLTRLYIAWAPFDWLLKKGILVDDSFYYFQIAQNIVHGHGVTFDTLTQTNGFHPLWLGIILPVFSFFRDRLLAIHVVLSLEAFFGTLAIPVLYLLFKQLNVRKFLQIGGICFFVFSPSLLLSGGGALTGLETSLNISLLLVFLLFCTHLEKEKNFLITPKSALFLGILSGFLFLTRTDNAIFILIIWAYLFFKNIRKNEIVRSFIPFVVLGASFILLTITWFYWSYTTFGSLIQGSGKSVPFMTREAVRLQGWGALTYLKQIFINLGDTFLNLFGLLSSTKFSFEFVTSLVCFILLPPTLLIQSKKSYADLGYGFKEYQRKNKVISLFLVSAVIFVVVQTFRSVYLRPWYHFSVVPIFFVAIIWCLEYLFSVSGERATRATHILLFAFPLLAVISFLRWLPIQSDELFNKYLAVEKMNMILPNSSKVGAWNAGIFGYFFDKGIIVNLDGLVNQAVYPNIQAHIVGEYVVRTNIRYITDGRDTLTAMGRYWDSSGSDIKNHLTNLGVIGPGSKDEIIIGQLR